MKPVKGLKNAHTPNTKCGMGDYYGTGIKAPTAKLIDGMGLKEVPPKKTMKPPRSLA